MVGMQGKEFGNHLCGGSLIASKFVLTAAHCINAEASEIQIVIGEHNLVETDETSLETKIFLVENIIIHENYSFPPNDIALLVLTEEVDLTIYNTVCLPDEGAKFAGQNALVYGESKWFIFSFLWFVCSKRDTNLQIMSESQYQYELMSLDSSMANFKCCFSLKFLRKFK